MAIIVIVTAFSLANGSFLPEVSAAVDSVLTDLSDPLIDPKSGMDPSEFAILFKDDQDLETLAPEQTDDTSDKDETTNDQSDPAFDTDITEIIDCDKEGHLFSDWYYLSYPSCTQKGELYRTCQRCGEVETGYSEALGHDMSNWMITVEPTCLNEGLETMTCSRCDHSETRTIEALGHNWTDWKASKEATCEDDGKEYRECERCHEKEYQTIEALGHAYGAWEYVDDNTHQRVCENCGEKEVSEHSWSELASIDDTNHGRVCSECGHEIVEKHNFEYTSNRNTTHTAICTICGHEIQENHSWNGNECSKCHASIKLDITETIYSSSSTNLGVSTMINVTSTDLDVSKQTQSGLSGSVSGFNIWKNDSIFCGYNRDVFLINIGINDRKNVTFDNGPSFSITYDIPFNDQNGQNLITFNFTTTLTVDENGNVTASTQIN